MKNGNLDRIVRIISVILTLVVVIVGIAVAWGGLNARIDYLEVRTTDLTMKWEATQVTLTELLVQIGIVKSDLQHIRELLERK